MFKKVVIVSFLCLFFFHLSASSTVSAGDSVSSPNLIQKIEEWYGENMNYASITLLMAAESSILPVPSEMVVPPAVYVAMDPKSDLSIFWIIVFATIGALIGASVNYLMGITLGRAVIHRFADSKMGRLLLLSSEKIEKSEKFFVDHGKTSTFVGRLIPVVRHLISIPAGLAKMNYFSFLWYTFLGAGLWNIILAALGYVAGENRELIDQYSHELSYVFVLLAVVLIAWMILKMRKKNKK